MTIQQLLFGGSPGPITGSFRTSATSTAGSSPYTFNAQDIGAAAANRLVVVTWSHYAGIASGPTMSSVTIGGITATILLQQGDGTSTDNTGIAVALVPTGTTATIVLTTNIGGAAIGIGVYALYGASATPSQTATDSGLSFTASASISSVAGSAIIAAVGFSGNSYSSAWTNLTGRFDTDINGSDNSNGAFDLFAAAQSSLAISSVATGATPPRKSMAIAAFRPG